jgi:hypothetical protein
MRDARADRLRVAMQDRVARGDVPGAIMLVARGDDVAVELAGARSLGGPPLTRDTIFRIASMSKPVTAVAALALVDDGTLHLDDPIERWLPELADRRVLARPDGPLTETVPVRRAITVRDLFTSWGSACSGGSGTRRSWARRTSSALPRSARHIHKPRHRLTSGSAVSRPSRSPTSPASAGATTRAARCCAC